MQRIVLLGSAGVGKTTLAQNIAARLSVPAIILDDLVGPGWTPEQAAALRNHIRELHAGDAWVSDGNFAAATFDIRLPRADAIVWVEAPRWLSTWRVVRRGLGRDETHSWRNIPKALRFVWNFDRLNRPRVEALRLQYGPDIPLTRLRSKEDVSCFLATL